MDEQDMPLWERICAFLVISGLVSTVCLIYLAIIVVAVTATEPPGIVDLLMFAGLASPIIGAGLILLAVRTINRRHDSRHPSGPLDPA